jgi:hypothetical protein
MIRVTLRYLFYNVAIVAILVLNGVLADIYSSQSNLVRASSIATFVSILGLMYYAMKDVRRDLYSTLPRFVEAIDARIGSTSRFKQNYAISLLGLLVGERFGSTFFGRPYSKSLDHWRRWWSAHKGELVWDKELRVYLIPNETPQ